MTQEILVPLDGSTLAEAILPYAAALARSTSSNLTLLRVIPPMHMIEPRGGVIYAEGVILEEYEDEPRIAGEYLAGIAADLQHSGITVHTKIENGDPATCILNCTANNTKVKYIAMATHGRSGLGRMLFGSVAEKMVHSASVPVLLLKSRLEAPDNMALVSPAHVCGNILVPLDGTDAAEEALEAAITIAGRAGAGITLLSVVPERDNRTLADTPIFPLWTEMIDDQRAEQLNRHLFTVAQQLRTKGLRVKTEVKEGDPAEEIIKTCDRDSIDMIIMSTHSRGGLQRLWLGSVAMEVVHRANKPVLLVRVADHAEAASKAEAAVGVVGIASR